MTRISKALKDLPQRPTELVEQLASFVKTEQDLSLITHQLMKQVVERALQAELSHHLEIDSATGNANSRNGLMAKTLKGNFGEMPIQTPRDRAGGFEPTLVRKGQTRFTAFDDQILSLYARGMSTRDIANMFQEMYGAEISHSLISKVTEAVLEEVHAWQSRTLDEVYSPSLISDQFSIAKQSLQRSLSKP